MRTINEQEFYAWIAPDGEIQITTMAEDLVLLNAITRLFSKSGLCKTEAEMRKHGFVIEKVIVTIKNNASQN